MSQRNKFFNNFESNWYLETYIDISKADYFVDYSKVDIGFTTENAVKAVKKNVSDKQLLDFHLYCRNLLKAVVAKLLEQDCCTVSTSEQSCIPGSLTYVRQARRTRHV